MKIKGIIIICICMLTMMAMGLESHIFANEDTSGQIANIESNATSVTPEEAIIISGTDPTQIIGYVPEKNPLHPKLVIPSIINGTTVTTIAGSACDEM